MPVVHYRYATVDGHRLFFREAGDPKHPLWFCCTGFPPARTCFASWFPRSPTVTT